MSKRSSRPSSLGIVPRWLAGMGLMSWRYLWQTTPLHRLEEQGDGNDLPPALPPRAVVDHLQPAESGQGPLFHRRFEVTIEEPRLDAAALMEKVAADFDVLLPSEVAVVALSGGDGRGGPARVDDEFVVRMPGPWDGPVRVVHRDESTFRLATLDGHLEAGQIEFRAHSAGPVLRFEIETWARPATRWVALLYTRLRLAKEMQLYMWVRAVLAAGELAGGHARGGVRVLTRCVPSESPDRGVAAGPR